MTYVAPAVADLAGSWTAADGQTLAIRAIRPDDAALEAEFVRGLSPQSRRLRFMNALQELTPSQLERFTHVDPAREVALVALQDVAGQARQVAVARFVVDPGPRGCEFALAVADAWQRRGLGRHLLSRLIGIARRAGLETIRGVVLVDNAGMLALARRLGFEVVPLAGEPGVRQVILRLDSPPR